MLIDINYARSSTNINNQLTVMCTTRDEHFHLLTIDGQTDLVIIVQTQGSCKTIVQAQGTCKTHIVIIVHFNIKAI